MPRQLKDPQEGPDPGQGPAPLINFVSALLAYRAVIHIHLLFMANVSSASTLKRHQTYQSSPGPVRGREESRPDSARLGPSQLRSAAAAENLVDGVDPVRIRGEG